MSRLQPDFCFDIERQERRRSRLSGSHVTKNLRRFSVPVTVKVQTLCDTEVHRLRRTNSNKFNFLHFFNLFLQFLGPYVVWRVRSQKRIFLILQGLDLTQF